MVEKCAGGEGGAPEYTIRTKLTFCQVFVRRSEIGSIQFDSRLGNRNVASRSLVDPSSICSGIDKSCLKTCYFFVSAVLIRTTRKRTPTRRPNTNERIGVERIPSPVRPSSPSPGQWPALAVRPSRPRHSFLNLPPPTPDPPTVRKFSRDRAACRAFDARWTTTSAPNRKSRPKARMPPNA